MPNWCLNFLDISGEKENIEKITSKLKEIEDSDAGVFETLVGIDRSGEGHMLDTLQLNINGWGTKWDVISNGITPYYHSNFISLSFETAWSPPIGFCQMLSKKYTVNCSIRYEEPGNDFCGVATTNCNGEISSNEEYSYSEGKYTMDNEGFWMDVENNIDANVDEYSSGEEFLNEFYSHEDYLSDEDREQIIEQFNQYK